MSDERQKSAEEATATVYGNGNYANGRTITEMNGGNHSLVETGMRPFSNDATYYYQ